MVWAKPCALLPSSEENSLESISVKEKPFKVKLDELHYNASAFDAYLKNHSPCFDFSSAPLLTSHILLKQLVKVSFGEEIDNSISTEISCADHWSASKEILEDGLSSLDKDMIKAVQKQADLFYVAALFHPQNSCPETDELESFLSNSMEFQILSKANQKKKDFTASLKDKKPDLLSSSNEIFSNENLKSISVTFELPNKEIPLDEMNTKRSDVLVRSAEQKNDLKTAEIFLPNFFYCDANVYAYLPSSLKDQAQVYEDEVLVKDLATLRVEGSGSWTIEKGFSNKDLFKTAKAAAVKPREDETPSRFAKLSTQKKRKNLLPQSQQVLEDPESKADFAFTEDKPIVSEKALLVATSPELSIPDRIIKTESLDVDLKDQEACASLEDINHESTISASFDRDENLNDYSFSAAEFASDRIETENVRFIAHKESFLANRIGELPESFLRQLKKSEIVHISHQGEMTPQNESFSTDEKFDVSFLQALKGSSEHFFIPEDNFYESVVLGDIQTGRLDLDERALTRDLHLASLKTSSIEIKENLYESFHMPTDCAAQKQIFDLPYEHLANKEISSSIKTKSEALIHALKNDLGAVSFQDDLNRSNEAILSDLEMTTMKNEMEEMFVSFDTGEITLTEKEYKLLADTSDDFIGDVTVEGRINPKISLPKLSKINNKNSFFLNPMLSLINPKGYHLISRIFDRATKTNKNLRNTGYNLFNWPTLDDLKTDSYPDSFALETKLFASDSDVYDFVCTLKTENSHVFATLPLNVLYILDPSTSIEPHRFETFKKAILTSIKQLDEDTTFNIAVIDKQGAKYLHEKSVRPSQSSQSFAKRFLDKVDQHPVSFTGLITTLKNEKEKAQNEITHRSCLILSDGNCAKNIRLDRQHLESLTSIDAGNFSIYTASVSDKNNKAMLSLLAKINHGFSMYTKTHASFPRKFAAMVRHIKRPLLHDIHISFPDSDDKSVYSNTEITPILLADKSFSFYGHSRSKDRARIFIQGRSGDRWVNILKELPMDQARKARYSLRKKLESQKTLLSLYSFLKTKDEKHLVEAKSHSQKFDLDIPLP